MLAAANGRKGDMESKMVLTTKNTKRNQEFSKMWSLNPNRPQDWYI